MGKVIDLEGVARSDALMDLVFSRNPDLRLPSYEETKMSFDETDSKVVGIRFPMELLNWIDAYSREKAFKEGKRVTRNNVVIEMIEAARAVETTKSSEEPVE
mgnify:CR=1 FL=1